LKQPFERSHLFKSNLIQLKSGVAGLWDEFLLEKNAERLSTTKIHPLSSNAHLKALTTFYTLLANFS